MKILISILVNEKSISTIGSVIKSIEKAIISTEHTCKVFIATDDIAQFDEKNFTRMTSFSINGYDEFQLHKISTLRNLCMDKATKEEFDYVLFIDSDNLIPNNAIDLLVDANKKDISGWYFCKNVPRNSGWRDTECETEPFIVDAATCGCRLIHSDIFKNIKFVYANMVSEEAQFSEDVKKLGFKSWIHPGVYSDHIGGGYTDEARTYRETQLNK